MKEDCKNTLYNYLRNKGRYDATLFKNILDEFEFQTGYTSYLCPMNEIETEGKEYIDVVGMIGFLERLKNVSFDIYDAWFSRETFESFSEVPSNVIMKILKYIIVSENDLGDDVIKDILESN